MSGNDVNALAAAVADDVAQRRARHDAKNEALSYLAQMTLLVEQAKAIGDRYTARLEARNADRARGARGEVGDGQPDA